MNKYHINPLKYLHISIYKKCHQTNNTSSVEYVKGSSSLMYPKAKKHLQ